jgi:predicted MPP superfamily phosphohydrolase
MGRDKMEDEKVQDTTTRLERELSRRDFVRRSLAVGQAVFIGGVLVGNFAGCTTASKKDDETEAGRKTNIKLAHITDTHVTFTGKNGTALKEESFNIFRDIIDQINEMGDIDFILFGGDNINNTDPGTKGFDEFMNIMSGVKVPYFAQFGNRESSPIPPGVALSKEQYAEKMKGHGLDIGSYSWSVSPVPGLRILGMDTTIEGHDNGEIPQAELKWIKEEIAKYPNDKIVTLSHHLLLPTWGDRDIPKWKKKYLLKNYQEVNTVLEGAPQVKACLTGHHHVSRVQIVNGLHYIASPAGVQYPHAFRTITINDNEARLEFHQVRDQRIIELGKHNLLTSKNAEEYAGGSAGDILAYCHGGELDNNVILKLR